MSEYFNRKVAIVLGEPGETGFRYEDLRVNFTVTKDDTPTPNSANITVYGFSRDTVQFLESNSLVVQLFAGYDTPGLIFLGDITKAVTTLEGPERRTKIESGDGQQAVTQSKISKSYGAQTDPADIIGDLGGSIAEKLGGDKDKVKKAVKKKASSLLPSTPTYPRGVALQGKASDELTKVTRANGLDWFIQDGELQIYKPGFATQTDAFVLSPTSGLIGSPKLTDKGRVEARSLLNSELRVGRLVVLRSERFEGFFVIRKVKYKGDSGWENEFYADLELTEKKAQ